MIQAKVAQVHLRSLTWQRATVHKKSATFCHGVTTLVILTAIRLSAARWLSASGSPPNPLFAAYNLRGFSTSATHFVPTIALVASESQQLGHAQGCRTAHDLPTVNLSVADLKWDPAATKLHCDCLCVHTPAMESRIDQLSQVGNAYVREAHFKELRNQTSGNSNEPEF